MAYIAGALRHLFFAAQQNGVLDAGKPLLIKQMGAVHPENSLLRFFWLSDPGGKDLAMASLPARGANHRGYS
ncbi:hypothetical protein [Phreatobacter oligotrophus]|uniref:hypothetical protein n=1 Tax=Phreatobacter oligotrophus TaxID=1122261 RepID=UPI0011B254C3|nr:hypothetical protein [Phreatobacter oligotrophus]